MVGLTVVEEAVNMSIRLSFLTKEGRKLVC